MKRIKHSYVPFRKGEIRLVFGNPAAGGHIYQTTLRHERKFLEMLVEHAMAKEERLAKQAAQEPHMVLAMDPAE